MGFLETDFELGGCRYSSEDLNFSRRFLPWVIRRGDPSWLDKPRGALAIHWNSATTPSAVHLMDLASALSAVSQKIDVGESDKFEGKIRQLLRSCDGQYEEVFSEICIGAILSAMCATVGLEPPTGRGNAAGGRERNTDYVVQFSGEPVAQYVEVTTLNVDRLQSWSSAVQALVARFQREISRRQKSVNLEILATIDISRRFLGDGEVAKLVAKIVDGSSGDFTKKLGEGGVQLRWSPAPRFENLDAFRAGGTDDFAAGMGREGDILSFAGVHSSLVWNDAATDQVFRSLQNVLNSKLDQFQLREPYVLVIRPNDLIDVGLVKDLVVARIFANDKYRRLSALGLLKLPFSQQSGVQPRLELLTNPMATEPLTSGFIGSISN